MKNLVIRAIGTLPDVWQKEAIHSYKKRLFSFGDIEMIELTEGHKGSEKPDINRVRKTESESLLKNIPEHATVIACDEHGKSLDSLEFSEKLAAFELNGPVYFLIGGSWGFDEIVKNRANLTISFGKMVFPHGLIRIMLIEQIYRAKMIAAGREYHK